MLVCPTRLARSRAQCVVCAVHNVSVYFTNASKICCEMVQSSLKICILPESIIDPLIFLFAKMGTTNKRF